MRAYPDLPEADSRVQELIEYFGWELGHKAPACRAWLWPDDPRRERLLEALGVTNAEFEVLHQYALVNRMDPARPDMYPIFDFVLERLEALGGPQELSVLDFGCGLGQIGLAFTLAGYRVVLNDVADHQLAFARFVHETRGLEPEIWRSPTRSDYYDTGADGKAFGLVVEWSVFEHVFHGVDALEKITGGLVPGGLFVTTTFLKDWTPEALAHWRRDAGKVADELFSGEAETWVREHFEELRTPPGSIAKVLVKRS